jgi:hypothetical protein
MWLDVNHYSNLFKEPTQSKMAEILKLIFLFPQLIEEEDNRALFQEISKEELLAIISSFKRDKSLGPYDWNVEFFKDFFDIVGFDLL